MSETKNITIRIDYDLYTTIVELADANTRTLNLQMQDLLKKGIARHEAEQRAIKQRLDDDPEDALYGYTDDSSKQQKTGND